MDIHLSRCRCYTMPDCFSVSLGFEPLLPRTHGECSLLSTARSFHSIDNDEDCSVISELSCDVDNDTSLHDLIMRIDPVIPLDIQDSRPNAGCCTFLDRGNIGAATVISSTCSSPFGHRSYSVSADDTMSTSSSVVDIISLHRVSFAADLGSHSSESFGAPSSHVSGGRNHLSSLPDELVCTITCYLDVESLSRTRLVSKRLLNLASRDEAGWRRLCETLWSQKAHVSRKAYSLLENGDARKAFYFARHEAVSRHEVSKEELCFDPSTGNGITWSFRFKEAAGSDWWEPWWSGKNARKMVFLDNGTVMEYIAGSPRNSHTADKSTKHRNFRLVRPFHDARGETSMDIDTMEVVTARAGLVVTWRFVSQPMDLPPRPHGAYIRLNIGGRDVPTYVVHRSPTNNWGFVMESCWGVYASFPLPCRRHMNESDPGESAQRPTRMRLRRTSHGVARWFNVADTESEDEEESDAMCFSSHALLFLEDSALSVTTHSQWREALLYNHGAVSLPEGEGATAEFDRVWSQALRPAVSHHNAIMDRL